MRLRQFGSVFALYEYDQLKKITADYQDRLATIKRQGEVRELQNKKELEEKLELFQESIEKEQAARIRALKSILIVSQDFREDMTI